MAADFTLSYLLTQFFWGFSGSTSLVTLVKCLLSVEWLFGLTGLRLLCSNPTSYRANGIAKTSRGMAWRGLAVFLKEPKAIKGIYHLKTSWGSFSL